MNRDWTTIAAGAGGTLATIAIEPLSTWFALGCGVLTFGLLARKSVLTFRGDLRAWRARRAQATVRAVEPSPRPKDGPETTE